MPDEFVPIEGFIVSVPPDRSEIEQIPDGQQAGGHEDAAEIIEATDSVAPGSGVLAVGGTRSTMLYYVRGDNFHEAALDILGSVRPLGDGRLKRDLPRRHPQFPREFAYQLGYRGAGVRGDDGHSALVVGARDLRPDIPAVRGDYLRYAEYDFEVSFEAPMYAIAHDDDIAVLPGSWWDDDDRQGTFDYATEWERYCDFAVEPTPEFVQLRLGQMAFRTESKSPPHEYPFPGLIRIPIPKELLKIRWTQVPWTYCQSRDFYPRRFLWRVNQNPWLGYEPGELLLEGYQYLERRNPHFAGPDVVLIDDVASEKLVDVELHIRVSRMSTDDAPVPASRNWIANGHNVQPHGGDRKHYYVTATGFDRRSLKFDKAADLDPANWTPLYLSAPFELMFTDPALPQPGLGTLRA